MTYSMKPLCWDIPARINGLDIFMNAIRGKNTEELLVGGNAGRLLSEFPINQGRASTGR
jgi:hypothetical protein